MSRAADQLAKVADPGATVVFGAVVDSASPEGAVRATVYAVLDPA